MLMLDADSCIERQNAELEVLKSIFDKDLKYENGTYIITLYPLHDSQSPEVHTKIDLHVVCSETYPETEPLTLLQNSKGLSKVQIDRLQRELEALTTQLKGEVMIFELTRVVREFLLLNNKPGTKSFYEEMVSRNESMMRAKHQSEEDRITKKRQDIQERVSRKEREVLESLRDASDSSDASEADASDGEWRRRVRFVSSDEKRCRDSEGDCGHRCCKYLQFGSKVLRGRCIEHEARSTTYCALDSITGEQLVVREWLLKPRQKNKDLAPILKQLESIQQELNYLKRLQHENIVAYLEFKMSQERDEICVYILQEHVCCTNLNLFSRGLSVDANLLRYFVQGMLSALSFLHHHNVFHRDLKASCVSLNKHGAVKLGGFSLVKRMDDIHDSLDQVQGSGRDKADKLGRKADVLQLGRLVAALCGEAKEPVPVEMQDFLDKCLTESEERRWSARQLLDHAFVKTPVSREPRLRRGDGRADSTQRADSESSKEEDESELLVSQLPIPKSLKSLSRLSSEFKVLKYLGQGSFGKVLKAKNKLDDCVYAIKAIELNPRNRQLNKKMIREVKLLSKLNHENVVRYYNSWIETANVDDSSVVTNVRSTPLQTLTDLQSYKAIEDLNSRGSQLKCRSSNTHNDDDDDSESESSDASESDFIEFNQSEASEMSSSIIFSEQCEGKEDKGSKSEEDGEQSSEIRCMYIQMEFCEKSTLRIAIDENLCDDQSRVWKLFREMVEGLAYIHEQDMIHRDLKPVNIFLDCEDRVKIGDFGLATRSAINRHVLMVTGLALATGDNLSHAMHEESHTGGVGTSYYVAPELQKHFGKTHYDKKVDIYSLGIILFEMCHPRFTTEMERFETLTSLRMPEVQISTDVEQSRPQQMELVRLLLCHAPGARPSCSELLQGDFLPPPQVEDAELREFVRYTLANPQSKAYKYLISSCFDQKANLEEDLTYHLENNPSEKQTQLLETTKSALERVLKRHGAKWLTTPLLLPDGEALVETRHSVRLMTHSGGVVALPSDLRTGFARHVARREMTRLRRYAIERVYKEKKVHGYHPREMCECAFDIVTSNPGDLTTDSEMLSVASEMVEEFPSLRNRGLYLRVNHTLLLDAILLNFNLEKLYPQIFKLLVEAKDDKHSRSKLEARLTSLLLNEQLSGMLSSAFQREDSLVKISAEVLAMVKRRREAESLAKKALQQLKMIVTNAEFLGLKVPVKVCLGVVNHIELSSGLMFDLVCPVRQKRRREACDVLLSGCRYDGLITRFRKLFDLGGASQSKDLPQAAVGLSVCLDRLVSALRDEQEGLDDLAPGADAVVCALGRDAMLKDKAELVRGLWAAGVVAYILENIGSLEELIDYGRENRVRHLITLKETERGSARVRTWEKYQEKKMNLTDVIDFVTRSSSSGGRGAGETVESSIAQRESKASVDLLIGSPTVNLHVLPEDKMAASVRRRYENQMTSRLTPLLANLSARPCVEVLGVFLESAVVKTLALGFELEDDAKEYAANVLSVVENMEKNSSFRNLPDGPQRQPIRKGNPKKKYLTKICDKIHSLYLEKSHNVIVIIYSLMSDKYKLILNN